MKLHEEFYFEITAEGNRSDVKKFVSYVSSGVMDDYFEFSEDMLMYSDNYNDEFDKDPVKVTISNDDYGIEISDIDPEDFLDVLCRGGRNILIHGNLYDIDDDNYVFVSHEGDSSYTNVENMEFNDELDREAYKEELAERDDY